MLLSRCIQCLALTLITVAVVAEDAEVSPKKLISQADRAFRQKDYTNVRTLYVCGSTV